MFLSFCNNKRCINNTLKRKLMLQPNQHLNILAGHSFYPLCQEFYHQNPVGYSVGFIEGYSYGLNVGIIVVSDAVGSGVFVSKLILVTVDEIIGNDVSSIEGFIDGGFDGVDAIVGSIVGFFVGRGVGSGVGDWDVRDRDGCSVGSAVGISDGCIVGSIVG